MTIEIDVRAPPAGAVRRVFDRILGALGLQRGRPELLREIADDWLQRVQAGFDRGVDPYGRAWIPSVKTRLCGGRTLIESGRLRRGISNRVTGETILFRAAAPYAATHQRGATIRARGGGYLRFQICGRWFSKRSVRVPARPFLPDARGLPGSWEITAQAVLTRRANRARI